MLDAEQNKLRQKGRLIKYWNGMIDKIFFEWYENLQKIPVEKRPVIIKICTNVF